MNDEEIMRKFNEKFGNPEQNSINQSSESVEPYKVSSNLNTINTDNINSQSSTSEQKLDIKDLMSTDTNTYFPNSNTVSSEIQSNEPPKYETNVNYNYVSTYSNTKKKKPTVQLTGENLVLILIVVVLFASILIIPAIYDFIRQIKMR